MIHLRPHHLLCTQGYSGKGYSDGFVENMDSIVDYLRREKDSKVMLTFSTDDLCTACPNKLGENLCTSEDKVSSFDSKTVKYFNLEEKEYDYHEITEYIDKHMTEEMLVDICEGCSWYPVSACRKNIIMNQ